MPSDFIANSAEFHQWLQKGLGRAVVYLKAHDPKPYREAVLYACTHDLKYDSQCEASREAYLLDLIGAVDDVGFFRNGLLKALTTELLDPKTFYLGQTVELARNFAEKGDSEIKRAMYNAVVLAGFEDAGHCYTDLIKLDGLGALIFAANHFLPTVQDDDLWQVNVLITALQDRDGEEAANKEIQQAERESSSLAQMLERCRVLRLARETKKDRVRPDYTALKQMIADARTSVVFYSGWGRTASKQELQAAASDLIMEKDEPRLLAYLCIFRYKRFPGSIARLLELAQSSNIRLARHAVSVLSQIANPEIRGLAFHLLGTPGKQGDGVDLLTSNYQQGDFQHIEARLREPMNIEDLHHFGIGLRSLVEMHCSQEAVQSLLLLYEKGPCSLCRGEVVRELIALGSLPDLMKEECRFGADVETRKLVQ